MYHRFKASKMDEPRNSYQPVQTTGGENERGNRKKHRDDEEHVPGKDVLTTDEKCCCRCLQFLDSPYLFVFLLSIVFFVWSAGFSATGGGILSTVEKRFQLKTSQMAPFIISNDVVSIVLVLFVAHFGHKSHRPRLIGVGGIITGVGFLLCMLPQFIYESPSQFSRDVGDGDKNENQSAQSPGNLYQVCLISDNTTGNTDTEVCTSEEQETSGSLMWQVFWIIIGQMLTGVGGAPISPLAITYMDDNLDRASFPIYIACISICSAVGPMAGFAVSGYCLSLHADFLEGPVSSKPGDPNWIGAWWLTYALFGVLFIIVCAPFVLFPKKIRKRTGPAETSQSQAEVANNFAAEIHQTKTSQNRGKAKSALLKGFFKAMYRLATNISFMSVILGACAYTVAFVGNLVFMPKYLETQFSLSATTAPFIYGIMITPGSLLGYLIGGIVAKKMSMTSKGMAGFVAFLQPVSLLLLVVLLFLGCENRDLAGLTTDYSINTTNLGALPNITSWCNSGCACPSDYTPVCGSDGVTYATPCHAGCVATEEMASAIKKENVTIFTNCSCVGAPSNLDLVDLPDDDFYQQTATTGECASACNTLIPFVVFVILSTTLHAAIVNTFFVVSVRVVEDDDRSLSIGLSSLMMRLLGVIPSPIMYGAVIQQACLLFQSSCGETGNCLVYDIVLFRIVYLALPLGLEVVAEVGYIVCYLSLKGPMRMKNEPELASSNGNDVRISANRDDNDDSEEDVQVVLYESSV